MILRKGRRAWRRPAPSAYADAWLSLAAEPSR